MTGLRAKIRKQRGKQLRLVEYTGAMARHWCEKGHIGYVLEGQLEIAFENETDVFKAHDGIFIPDGKEHRHSAKILTDKVRMILVEDL